jgi:pimeloyl-ACP methyl ester carboxylesterase
MRLRGPTRDADLKDRLPKLTLPTLVLFGTLDAVIPPEMGHRSQGASAECRTATSSLSTTPRMPSALRCSPSHP